jgi:competence protein ComEC
MSKFIYWTLVIVFLTAGALWYRVLIVSDTRDPEILFLPVGQGDSELVRVGKVNVLIDAGPGRAVSTALDGILGTGKRIDVVLVSHGDSDHISGLAGILVSRDIGAIVYSGTTTPLLEELLTQAREKHIPILTLQAGDRVVYASSTIEVLWPTRDTEALSRNDTSLVVEFRVNGACAIFTGDIGEKTETDLTQLYQNALDCDVLKVAHHGSKYSSSEEFLDAVSPQVSVIEVGKNSYGHPTSETLARLAQAGSGIWRTDQDGLVRVIFKPQSLLISPKK